MHVMLDLETWGTLPGCAIRSIGAVGFDLKSGIVLDNSFYANVDEDSCIDAGLQQELATVQWWEQQSEEAKAACLTNPLPLAQALSEFYTWFVNIKGVQVWAQGASFDPPIIEHAMRAVGIKVPWKFWNIRDTRTVYDVAGFDHHAEKRGGTAHNALDDCMHQIKMVHAAMELLGKRGE